jgi:hypothetical protein
LGTTLELVLSLAPKDWTLDFFSSVKKGNSSVKKSTFFYAGATFCHAGITFFHAAALSVKKSNQG